MLSNDLCVGRVLKKDIPVHEVSLEDVCKWLYLSNMNRLRKRDALAVEMHRKLGMTEMNGMVHCRKLAERHSTVSLRLSELSCAS